MFCVSRSKKKKKHDILFPEEVVVKEEPGLEKPREKVCALSFCPSQSFGRLLMLEYPYTTTMILANVDEMRRRSEEKEVGMARGGEMTERGGGGRRGGEGWTFLPGEWLLILYFSGMREMISTLETDTGTGMKGRTDTGRTDMQERTEAEMRNRWELFEGELLLEGINSFRTGWQQQEAGLLL